MPEPIEILGNKVADLTSKIDALGLKEREKEAQLKEAETKQERDVIKSSIAGLQADIAKTSGLLEELTKSNKTLCDLVPSLCTKGELDTILSEKLKPKEPEKPPVTPPPAEPPKPEETKKEGLLDTGHENIEDLLACPECLLGHIKKIGFDKAAVEICKDDEACKAAIVELIKKGYKIEEPEIKEPEEEEISEGKDEEGKEGSGFTLGAGEEASAEQA